LLLVIAACCLDLLSAQSQLGTGALNGVVTDPTGDPVAEAGVTVTNTSTGLARQISTSVSGQFIVPVLPTGTYSVRVEKQGFSTLEQAKLMVNVGSTTTLQLQMKIGTVETIVDVMAESPMVDTTRSEEVSLVDRDQINELPINGRRADQFALLTPGVSRDGPFGLLSYRGIAGVFNNFTVEGNDDNQSYFSEARGRTRIASSISANAIQEFQVGKSNFLPEYGRTIGGGINTVFRSGTNDLHGDGFYYFRNQNLSARDPLAIIRPEEQRQQFGGALGGPVRKNKLFFFLNYDQQLRNFPLLISDLSGVLTNGKPVLPANPTPADQARFDADMQAFNAGVNFLLGKFPGGGPGHTMPRNFNQNLGLAKVDWLLNTKNTVSVTYNHLNARALNGIQSALILGAVGNNGSDDVRIHSLNMRLTSTLTARKINELRFQWSRDFEFEFANMPPPNVAVGSFTFGRATYLERAANPDEHRLQFIDNFSYIPGAHAFKFGGEVNRSHDRIDNPAYFGGAYSYSSALTFGRDLLNAGSRNYTNYRQNFGAVGGAFRVIDYALFAQDQWKLAKRLTLNYGLRYDYQSLPEPVAPNPAIPETQRFHADRSNLGPRVGAAYDLRGNGKTVLRGGYAMIFGRTPNGTIDNALRQTGLLDVDRTTIALTLLPADPAAPVYPAILPALPAAARGSTTVFRLDPKFQRPRVQEVNAGVERRLSGNLAVSVSYIYTKGARIPLSFDANLIPPNFARTYQLPDGTTFTAPFSAGVTRTSGGVAQSVNASRPNPAFGAINVVRSLGESWYNAMLVEVKRRMTRGLQFSIGYTLARVENVSGTAFGDGAAAEGPFGGGDLQNQFDLPSNRGRAPTAQTQRLVANGIWNPRFARGFRLSGIFSADSGRPYSTVLSIPNIPFSTQDGRQWNGFGGVLGQGGTNLLPTAARNGNTGDANYRLDLRLARDIRLTERFVLELLGEGFNVFNRSNFNSYNTTAYIATATTATTALATPVVLRPSTNFGTPRGDAFTPDGTGARRFQLAVRFRF
jgi:outer membrane receptor protein involved in Fe transport